MESRNVPNKKITIRRFLLSFIISYAFFFAIVFIILSWFNQSKDIFTILSIALFFHFVFQIGIHASDIFFEFKATREDWKNPQPNKISCIEAPVVPQWIKSGWFWFKTQLCEPIFFYSIIFDFILIQKGWNVAVSTPAYHSNNEHDAIIIISYSAFSREYFSVNGLDLLIPFFVENKINFKVYCCENSENFVKIVNDPTTKTLWIFGHGYRGGVKFSDKTVSYSSLFENLSEDSKNKNYVYQFHCNAGCEKSLSEYVANGRGFANYKRQTPYAVRGYIKNILQEKSWRRTP
jgi:hypothetical protein